MAVLGEIAPVCYYLALEKQQWLYVKEESENKLSY